jgi:hypothetical protein
MKFIIPIFALLSLSACAAGNSANISPQKVATFTHHELCVMGDFHPLDKVIKAEKLRRKAACYPIEAECKTHKHPSGCVKLRNIALADGLQKMAEQKARRQNAARISSQQNWGVQPGQTVYAPSQCAGTIVAGVCHGGIIPNPALQKTCHGEMLNGTCTGPMF